MKKQLFAGIVAALAALAALILFPSVVGVSVSMGAAWVALKYV